VSVATQLLRLPACLLLDEPTSGLDATNALSLVKTLHTFAHRGGANIIMTIHQPRKEIFRFLDTLTILVGGRILFSGAPKEAFDHFDISRKLNIGDEVLDQLGKAQLDQIVNFQTKYETGPLGKRMEEEMVKELVYDFTPELATQLEFTLTTSALADGQWSWAESSSAPLLMYVLLSRTMKRGGFDLLKTITISLFGGLLVGVVFLGTASRDSYARHVSMCYLSVATMTFLQGTFIGDRYWGEKFMYTFESEAGTARPWLSFLVSLFSRIVVSSSLEALAFAVPVFFLGQMHNELDQVRMYLLLITMCGVCTAVQYLMVEIYFMKPNDKRTGALVNIALLSLSALFNGFIIQLKDLPIYLSWLPYCMLSYWAFVGTLLNDLTGFTLTCTASILECSARTGDALIKSLKYDDRDLFQCLFALLIMTGLFLFIGILFFFFRWVSPIGSGLKRIHTEEGDLLMEQFFAKAQAQDNNESNTMKAVLDDGKRLKIATSDGNLTRTGSDGKLKRLGSAEQMLKRTGSDASESSSTTNMLLNPPQMFDQEDFAKTMPNPAGDGGPDTKEEERDVEVTSGKARGTCCSCRHDDWYIQLWLSRIGLFVFFVIDFLAAAVICNGQEDVVDFAAAAASGASFSLNVTLGQITDGVTSGVTSGFVVVSVFFWVGYLLQYIIQLGFLFPERSCNRIVLLDIIGLIFVGIDFLLLIILITQGNQSRIQIYLLTAIRGVRLGRLLSFWFKIAAFHELRVIAYLEYKLAIMETFDATLGENVGNDLGENQADVKPPIPPKSSKPAIDPELFKGLDKKPVIGPPTGLIARAVHNVRQSVSNSAAVERRKSLQQRISMAKNARVSAKLGGFPGAPPVPGRSGAPPVPGRSGGGAAPPIPGRSVGPPPPGPPPSIPGRPGGPPPPVPSKPPMTMGGIPSRSPPTTQLPASMRVSLHGPGIPPRNDLRSVSNRISNRVSMQRGGIISASGNSRSFAPPPVPSRSNAGAAPPPPSRGPAVPGRPPAIPSRSGIPPAPHRQSLSGFGVSPGAMQMMQQARQADQTRSHQKKLAPSYDEI
jgi:hypothetical protein